MRRGEASQERSPRDVHSVENAYDRSERRRAWCIGVLMPCGTPAAFVGGARRVTSGLPTIRPECAVREHVARLFFSQSIRLTRADGDGFLFCNRCAVRRFTLLMKRETLQSSTAPYFDGGSFRFAETRAAEPALHSRARSFSTLLFVDLDVAARYEPSIAVGGIRSGDADEKRVLARTRFSIIAGVYSIRVAQFLVHLGVALEGSAVA